MKERQGMLPSAIITIRELIVWEYARLMAEEAVGNRNNWLFTLHSFSKLDSDKNRWLRLLEEEVRMNPNQCAYCAAKENLVITRIVPKKMCPYAELHNGIRACKNCNSSKSDKDLVEWKVFEGHDSIGRSALAKYLKMLYICHECRGTVNNSSADEGGRRELVHLSYIFQEPCSISKKCPLG